MSSAVSANRPTRCRREEGTAASELGATGLLSLWGSVSNCRDLANEDFLMGELADPDTQKTFVEDRSGTGVGSKESMRAGQESRGNPDWSGRKKGKIKVFISVVGFKTSGCKISCVLEPVSKLELCFCLYLGTLVFQKYLPVAGGQNIANCMMFGQRSFERRASRQGSDHLVAVVSLLLCSCCLSDLFAQWT